MYGYVTYGTPKHNTILLLKPPWRTWTASQYTSTTPQETSFPILAIALHQKPQPKRPHLFASELTHPCHPELHVLVLEDQETRCCHELNKKQGNKTRGRELSNGSAQRRGRESAYWQHCAVLFVFVFCFVVLGGSVPDMTLFLFLYYISTNLKLTYILPLPFYFCVADPP